MRVEGVWAVCSSARQSRRPGEAGEGSFWSGRNKTENCQTPTDSCCSSRMRKGSHTASFASHQGARGYTPGFWRELWLSWKWSRIEGSRNLGLFFFLHWTSLERSHCLSWPRCFYLLPVEIRVDLHSKVRYRKYRCFLAHRIIGVWGRAWSFTCKLQNSDFAACVSIPSGQMQTFADGIFCLHYFLSFLFYFAFSLLLPFLLWKVQSPEEKGKKGGNGQGLRFKGRTQKGKESKNSFGPGVKKAELESEVWHQTRTTTTTTT